MSLLNPERKLSESYGSRFEEEARESLGSGADVEAGGDGVLGLLPKHRLPFNHQSLHRIRIRLDPHAFCRLDLCPDPE